MPGRIVRDAQADDDLVEIAAHLILEEYLDVYLDAAALRRDPKGALFRSLLGPAVTLRSDGLSLLNALLCIA